MQLKRDMNSEIAIGFKTEISIYAYVITGSWFVIIFLNLKKYPSPG